KFIATIGITACVSIPIFYYFGKGGVVPSFFILRIVISKLKDRKLVLYHPVKEHHPAEKSMGKDIRDVMPNEMILHVMEKCNRITLTSLQITCKALNDLGKVLYGLVAKKTLGDSTATLLFKGRADWKDVLDSLKKPYTQYQSDELKKLSPRFFKELKKQGSFKTGEEEQNFQKLLYGSTIDSVYQAHMLLNSYRSDIDDKDPASLNTFLLAINSFGACDYIGQFVLNKGLVNHAHL